MTRLRPRIALVEDDEPLRRALARMLSLAGYDVTAFHSAEAFLEREEAGLPACIVLDLRLPRMQGLELHRQLERDHGHVAVVFITSDQQLAGSDKVRRIGRTCLVKPLDEPELFEAIAEATRSGAAGR